MDMKFISTRGGSPKLSFLEAVAEGLAPDGGLYVPENMPCISDKLDQWEGLSYADLCFEFLKLFATDIPDEDLRAIVYESYKTFDDAAVAPLTKLDENVYLLELYHGPTLAFKDFALQFLGNLYEYMLDKSNRKINVLGATSGDTGSAAINGLLGKKNVNIFILYPEGRISPLQERQMTCTGANNVYPIAINGTFDDAQAIVKSLFGDVAFKADWNLSAVNSINLARILAQCVYYIYACLKLPKDKRKNVLFSVPTGNFGNVLAGWLAWKAGLQCAGFKVSTNQNDILYRLFSTGVYKVAEVLPSHAPSMDIQIASNFERFIYYSENGNSAKVCEIMQGFKKSGEWVFENFKAEGFTASRMSDEEIPLMIKKVKDSYGVVVDPHTACGFKDLPADKTAVVLSTAHPAKFPKLISDTLGEEPISPVLESLKSRQIIKTIMAADVEKVRKFICEFGIR